MPPTFPCVRPNIGVAMACPQFPECFIAGTHALPLRPNAIPKAAAHPPVHPPKMGAGIGKLEVVYP
ncbi:MAG: hypothetical protein RI575_05630, partial [Balneolaceae bacterium]|nr:hypothetical protein [Balneolaceae bacterium]